jgi:hypothetical protein|tara:strand:+ start:397 stop:606 length:210 start_codon:yes stop_codon:yes gene_type:complete
MRIQKDGIKYQVLNGKLNRIDESLNIPLIVGEENEDENEFECDINLADPEEDEYYAECLVKREGYEYVD